ncbi:NAD(P)H-binding protein [Nocardiopsis xinjiangensis]|uniref:NAD(P)H-binding protein n=1 Tax=Nocardiopsis xinjiangensis TaxID=124285 RepID=UPI000344A518|nr:NAD(P)H-binding protein [Nocardiopsis xinjiangensis]
MNTLVIGGTGTTGSRVARKLGEQGHRARVASRTGSGDRVRFDWHDPATHREALAGVDAVYLVAPIGEADPEPLMTPFLERAAREGVGRAVLLSASAVEPGTPGLGLVHDQLVGLFDGWAVLRPSWFMDNFTGDHLHARTAREFGEIVSATGTGRVAFVAADDIADVAVAALIDPVPHNTDHIITGPEALSYDEVAAILGEVTGRPVRHRSVSTTELAGRWTESGMPPAFARLLADLDAAVAAGAEDRTTSVVAEVTGHEPRSFRGAVSAALR